MQTRQREPELMDDPSLDTAEHLNAREGLARLNIWSGAAHAIWTPLFELAKQRNLKTLRVLDIATGGADVPLRLWRIARSHGIELQIDGCDMNEKALEHARKYAARVGAPSKFFKLDVSKDTLPRDYDVVITSLFIHHLAEEETIKLMESMKSAARQMVMVVDLERTRVNLALVWLATRLLSQSRVVHFDGPASVRNSYTSQELAALAERAGLKGALVREAFPCRMMLTWKRD